MSARSQPKTVVDDADLEQITSCKRGILDRAKTVRLSSATAPYLDCDGYRELLKLDNKIIPVLIWDLVKIADAYVIYGKKHYSPYPQNDKEWLERLREDQERRSLNLLPRFIVLQALAATSYGKAGKRTGFDGGDEAYQWFRWWDENKGGFDLKFQGAKEIAALHLDANSGWPQLSCRVIDGLLDVRADRATVKNIIENAAAAAGVPVSVRVDANQGDFLVNLIVAVNYREMSFDEFASAIAQQMSLGYPWGKEDGTYRFGTGEPAPGRWMMKDIAGDLTCEIKMDRTVFKNGEKIPLDFRLRSTGRQRTGASIVVGAPAETAPVYFIEIMDDYGKRLPEKNVPRVALSELQVLTLDGGNPEKQYTGMMDLAKLFNFENPGNYTVRLKYRVDPGPKFNSDVWRGELTSGSVFLRITK